MARLTRLLMLFGILSLFLFSTAASSYGFKSGESASLVIGQSKYTTDTCTTTTKRGLCTPYGVTFGSSGGLWVADYANSRVLKYNAPLSKGEAASLVLGQSSFTTGGCTTSQTGLCGPQSVVDENTNIWVADTNNNRVLEFKAPISTGEAASIVIGQSSFTTHAYATTRTSLFHPYSIAFDPSGNLWVADTDNNRVLEFKTPFSNGEAASLVIGQSSFTADTCAAKRSGLCFPSGIAFGTSGGLWVADDGNSRVLKFDAPLSTGEAASLVLGQSTFTGTACATTKSGMCDPVGIVDENTNIWVADTSNNRVLEYEAPIVTGEAASIVIGQSNFTTKNCATTRSGLCAPNGIAFDSSGNLWVADTNNNRVLNFS